MRIDFTLYPSRLQVDWSGHDVSVATRDHLRFMNLDFSEITPWNLSRLDVSIP